MLILFCLMSAPQAPKPPQAPPVIEQRVFALETKVSWLENDVAALKRDINAKCDIASKSPEPKPASKCPDGVCADCKCKVGDECGCLKLKAAKKLPKFYTAEWCKFCPLVENAIKGKYLYEVCEPLPGMSLPRVEWNDEVVEGADVEAVVRLLETGTLLNNAKAVQPVQIHTYGYPVRTYGNAVSGSCRSCKR